MIPDSHSRERRSAMQTGRVRAAAAAVLCAAALMHLSAAPAAAQGSPAAGVQRLLADAVRWMLETGRLVVAAVWLVTGFLVLLRAERGIGSFVFVALAGLAIVYAPDILRALGVDISAWVR
jgi:hypothetical protein